MTTISSFTYDGDGKQVKCTVNGVTTTYIGDLSEWTGSASTLVRYYYADGVRVAMRQGGTVYYLLGDHLGSTSVVATSSGGLQGKQLYKAWGEPRYASASLPTAYTYTGQYSYTDDIATQGVSEGFGLMFYNARWYDPYLNRWTQLDTLAPLDSQGVQAWDRYAYANNNPVKYNDPTGHCVDPDGCYKSRNGNDYEDRGQRLSLLLKRAQWTSWRMQQGQITDVDALADLMDYAAPMYTITVPDGGPGNSEAYDVNGFLTDIGEVVGGLEINGTISDQLARALEGNFLPGSAFTRGETPYYIGYSAFDPRKSTNGFQSIYNSTNDNQIQHFAGGISGGNAYGGLGRGFMLANETSEEDIRLYYKAFEFVDYLHSGASLNSASWWIMANLGR